MTSCSIQTSYWWPGLSSFVSSYIQGCAICQQFKVRTQPQCPSLIPIPSLSECIFGQVGINFMTDLPPSDGFVYNNRPHADRSQSPFEIWYGLALKAIPEAFEYHDYPKTEERLQLLTQWHNDTLLTHEYTQ